MLNESNIPLEEDGIEEEILVDEEVAITKAMWGDIGGNIENQTDLQNALDAKQDSLTEAQLNAVNSGITAEKVTTYDGYADQIASKADQSALNDEATTREQADTALGTRIDDEVTARQQADNGLQTQIDAITSKSDVVDVVANYAALQAYDTSTLGNNDVIKVLDDETHEDALTYYRWSTTTQTWSYIGQEAPYYSKGQMDVMLQGKQDKLTAGANIQIQNGTISATDTTYTAGSGLNLNGTEFSADTDVLATKEDLEDYYTKSETDTFLAPKLEAEVVAELPATGEEDKLYLTPKAHTTQTATGNPITATVAEDAGALESFQLDGDTYQQTYTGKNLCGGTLAQLKNRNPSGTWNGNQYFQSGITWTVYENADGTIDRIEASGQATEDGKTFYIRSFDRQQFEEQLGSEETYTLSGCPQGGSGYYVRVASIPWKAMLTDRGSSATGTLVPADNYNSVHVILGVDTSAGQVNNLVFRPQLELGSTATSYEPYVGGTPSPNPDYPQPIQTVTGEQTITVVGKNLISANWESGRYNNSTGVKEPFSDNVRTDAPIAVQPNTTYVCSRNGSGLAMNVLQYKADGSFISAATISSGNSFTTGADTYYITMFRGTSGGTEGIQLELGSTITSYVPYKATSYPINLGKNLLSVADETTTAGTAASTVSNNNHFEISGTVSASWGFQLVPSRKQIAPIQPGTYTLSITNPLPYDTTVQFRNTSSEASLVGNLSFPSGTTSITFTLNKTANYITWWSTASVGTAVTASFDAMIEAGSTATEYAPYFEPIELCKLGTYQDYIWKDGDDWKLHKVTVKAELNGTEAWNNSSPSAAYPFYVANIFDKIGASVQATNEGEAYFSHFSITGQILGANEYIGACLLVDNPLSLANVRVRLSDMSSGLESFKTMLSDKKPVIYAKKATATDTTITDTNLIAQLEAIRTASLENGANTITNSAAGSNLAGDMEIGYYGFNPRNRYDKWLWLDINNEYEQIGS